MTQDGSRRASRHIVALTRRRRLLTAALAPCVRKEDRPCAFAGALLRARAARLSHLAAMLTSQPIEGGAGDRKEP